MDEQLAQLALRAAEAGQTGDLGGLFEFSASGLISSLIFGCVGMWMLNRARKRGDYRLVAISFALMFYPYVTRGPWADWGVGTALCALAYFLW